MLKKVLIWIVTSFCLGACAETSTIRKVSESKSDFENAVYSGQTRIIARDTSGSEQYRVFHEGATGFVPVQTVREEAEQRARIFCEGQGKWMKLLQETTSVPPHVLGNFPRAELIFSCIDKMEKSTIEKTEKPAIERAVITQPAYEDQLYIRLTNLKKLLDNGTITKEEFEQQKSKILNP